MQIFVIFLLLFSSRQKSLASPLGEVAERSEVGEGLAGSSYSPKTVCYRTASRTLSVTAFRRASSPTGGSQGRCRTKILSQNPLDNHSGPILIYF